MNIIDSIKKNMFELKTLLETFSDADWDNFARSKLPPDMNVDNINIGKLFKRNAECTIEEYEKQLKFLGYDYEEENDELKENKTKNVGGKK